MTKKVLRPHQVRAIEMLRESIKAGRNRPLLQMPTGAGKTATASAMIDSSLKRGKRSIFVVPAITLIDQTVERLNEDGIFDIGVIQAKHPKTNPEMPVQVASVQTLANWTVGYQPVQELRTRTRQLGRNPDGSKIIESYQALVTLPPIPDAKVVFIDECHSWFELYETWMSHERWRNVPFVGLSATPWAKGLGKHYNDLIKPITLSQLIDQGYLSKFRVFAPSHPDLSEVRTVAGEYHEGDLAGVMNQGGLVADVVDNWLKHGNGEPTLCFAVDRAHAAHLQAQFQAAGVRAAYMDAFTTSEDRTEIERGFRAREIEVVCNCAVLTKGVDWDVRCIIMARPTKSPMLFVQIFGRMLRTAPGKTMATCFDHADNHLRLGFVTDIDQDQLDDGTRKSKDKPEAKEALPKECQKCHVLKPPKMPVCPSCGFKAEKMSQVTCDDGDLVEIRPGEHKTEKFTKEQKQTWYSMLLGIAHGRNYKPGFAANTFRDKTGVWPRGLEEIPLPPNQEVINFVRHKMMKRTFGKAKASA